MFRIAWRRSYQNSFCDDEVKDSGALIGPSDAGVLRCSSGCGSRDVTITSVRFYCTDYSEIEDWTAGYRSLEYIFPRQDVFILR